MLNRVCIFTVAKHHQQDLAKHLRNHDMFEVLQVG